MRCLYLAFGTNLLHRLTHTHKRTHAHRHTDTYTYTYTHSNAKVVNKGVGVWASLFFPFIHAFTNLLPVSRSAQKKTFQTTLPRFFSKDIFCSFHVSLSYFRYKTCTGCLEQQQKYNIQFICNFKVFFLCFSL